ncbi:MAG: esterase-like activity of phytase family protein [Kiritimatiellae bacterium]|nr:esterase-like activity of phytase family protein [Kiritimatiellia bacterium]
MKVSCSRRVRPSRQAPAGFVTGALFVLLWLAAPAAGFGADAAPLQLDRALPVDGPPNSEPSGLTMHGDVLLAVSDKHDDTVFRIVVSNEVAVLEPHVTFRPAAGTPTGKCDFEGITAAPDGTLYLASERHARVLRVSPDGTNTAWVTPDLRPFGKGQGLFQANNAGLEGIVWLGPDRVLLCAERQERGLLELDLAREPVLVGAWGHPTSSFRIPKGRSADWTGLCAYAGRVYALQRNAGLVCRLARTETGWGEGPGWSYEHIETREDLRYRNMRFGKAEGLCADERFVYVILDNNGIARQSDPADKRPLLLILHRPRDF